MSNVLQFPKESRQVSLREAYCDAIRTANNALTIYDKATAQTMVGYLTAAVVAFRVTGDAYAADICEEAAHAIAANWREFKVYVPYVHDQLLA